MGRGYRWKRVWCESMSLRIVRRESSFGTSLTQQLMSLSNTHSRTHRYKEGNGEMERTLTNINDLCMNRKVKLLGRALR